MVGTDPFLQEPASEQHQVVRIVALSASGRVDESFGVKGPSRVELPYEPNDIWSILITSSAHDVVLVVGSGGASFQLEEFRLQSARGRLDRALRYQSEIRAVGPPTRTAV
jgi:hypothetical protein